LNFGGAKLFENEIRLVCQTFEKCRIKAAVLKKDEFISLSDTADDPFFAENNLAAQLSKILPVQLNEQTLYKILTSLDFRYICLLISEEDGVLFVGPYLSEPPLKARILEIGEKCGVSPKHIRYLEEYYNGIAVLDESSPLLMMLDGLCEHIWSSPSFAIIDINEEKTTSDNRLRNTYGDEKKEDNLVSMKTLERRYEFENEMIQAVSLGQIHKEKQILAAFSEEAFEKRLTDYLRNAKNYSVIMNTLLRKAAERGGVHPFYIDRVSSDFAAKIERMAHIGENAALMREMFRTYCRLVRKHSTSGYSFLVQKTLIAIDSDLSVDLSLSALAKMQNVSAGYLSSVFKKELGVPLSSFVAEKRVEHAKYLLVTTQLQIQSIALHCGIVDVQYFSKIFKNRTGKTPKEYRESFRT